MTPTVAADLRSTLFLEERGRRPAHEDPLVRGIVLDVRLEEGLDTLAAYADGTARYLNHGGNVIIWDAPDSRMGSLIDAMLEVGPALLPGSRAMPYGQYPVEPAEGPPSVTLLGPDALHVRQLGSDEPSGRLMAAGAALMTALIEVATGSA
jgi:hypothetical protein